MTAGPAGAVAGGAAMGHGGPAYPIALDLSGRAVVVVGGGQVALRRARGLLAAAAVVTVIAPALLPEFDQLDVRLVRRGYLDGDLDGCWLAHAATDDPE
ncbi:MAG: NAD(P)-dependent oxidoreductase, partial [Streptosporangiaceae bacterium]